MGSRMVPEVHTACDSMLISKEEKMGKQSPEKEQGQGLDMAKVLQFQREEMRDSSIGSLGRGCTSKAS